MFQALFKAPINAKLSNIQFVKVQRGEVKIAYLNRMLETVSEIERAHSSISALEKKHALLRKLTKVFEILAKIIIAENYNFHEAASKLIFREMKLLEREDSVRNARFV